MNRNTYGMYRKHSNHLITMSVLFNYLIAILGARYEKWFRPNMVESLKLVSNTDFFFLSFMNGCFRFRFFFSWKTLALKRKIQEIFGDLCAAYLYVYVYICNVKIECVLVSDLPIYYYINFQKDRPSNRNAYLWPSSNAWHSDLFCGIVCRISPSAVTYPIAHWPKRVHDNLFDEVHKCHK